MSFSTELEEARKIVVIAFQWSVFSTQAHLSSLSEKRRFHFNLEIVLHVFTKDLCASDSCGLEPLDLS